MSAEVERVGDTLPLRLTRQVDALCDEFEASLHGGGGYDIGPFLERGGAAGRQVLLRELALLAFEHLRRAGLTHPQDVFLTANSQIRRELEEALARSPSATPSLIGSSARSSGSGGLVVRCPHCHSAIDLIVDASLVDINCSSCGGRFSLINEAEHTREANALANIAHFELVERLGMGEFGTVWKARDTILDRTVALKIPRREHLDAATVEKFMREARAAAQLRHPNIVSTHEVGRDGDTLYIVIDYVRGVLLADMMSDHRLGVRESAVIAAKIADALDHAHQSGVIHRDLKPSNILIDDDGEPQLMDFGLAKRKETEITITTDGAIVGTPAYMSPEQARGEAAHVDGRTDVYSLGVMLFQLLTGELPFRGSMRMILHKIMHDDPPGPRSLCTHVPKDLDTISLKCLEKEPSRRYATAGDLAADLRRFLAGEPVLARRLGNIERSWRWVKRNRVVAALLAATILTLCIATVVSTYQAHRAKNALYDSLLQEMKLTRELRSQGYGATVQALASSARRLRTTRIDDDELRLQLTQTMGDFVAHPPTVLSLPGVEATAIEFSRDGRRLFAGAEKGQVIIYDLATGKPVEELVGHTGRIMSLAVGKDGDWLVSADGEGLVQSWRRNGERWEPARSFAMGDAPYTAVLSPAGDLAAWMKGATIDVWDVPSGKKLRALETEAEWQMRNAVFDAARNRVIAGFLSNEADRVGWAVWELDTGKRLHEVNLPTLGGTYPNGLALSAAGDRLAIGFDEGLLAYRTDGYERTSISGIDAIKAVAFRPRRPTLAAVNIRGKIAIWNPDAQRQVATLHLPQTGASNEDLAFSRDGRQFAASNANSIYCWDLAKADEKTVFNGHDGGIPCAAFDDDRHLLVTGGKDNLLRFWDSKTGAGIGTLDLGIAGQSLSLLPEREILAVGCMGGVSEARLRLLDSVTRETLYQLDPQIGDVHSLSSAKGRQATYLAACGPTGVVLWKVSANRPVGLEEVMRRQRDWCLSTSLNRSGTFLVWAQNDWSLRAWDIEAERLRSLS
ncbi:MAG TPA: serine/threonine-protein kinase, partial [Lacipirellula sp.]